MDSHAPLGQAHIKMHEEKNGFASVIPLKNGIQGIGCMDPVSSFITFFFPARDDGSIRFQM